MEARIYKLEQEPLLRYGPAFRDSKLTYSQRENEKGQIDRLALKAVSSPAWFANEDNGSHFLEWEWPQTAC
jgi:hypothetical protein